MIPLPIVIALVAGAIGLLSGYAIASHRAGKELAEVQAVYARHREASLEQSARWEAQQRAQEAARVRALMETINEAHRETAAARAAADHLDRVAGVLRTALIAAYAPAAEASGDSTAAPGSSTASGPGLVPADVFSWADPALRELARAYDAARIAGLACERAYDALSKSNLEVRPTTD